MKRNKFSLSNYKLFTCNQGELVPCAQPLEVIPGDAIQFATNALIRVSPLNAPVMHPVHARIHHWFVPFRLIWEDFENFITGGSDGLDASVFPTITFSGGSGAAVGSLADYLGVPTGVDGLEVSALPFRAYAKIYNEAYRNNLIQTELTIDETSGADTTTSTTLKNVNWENDYFTASYNDTQLGDEVTLPLGTSAPITDVSNLTRSGTGKLQAMNTATIGTTTTSGSFATSDLIQLEADLTAAGGATVNQWRESFALQRYAEARMRYGSRYTEYLKYLGVRPADSRLQRPEYLGGGKQTVQFSEILQTGVDSSDSGVGNLAGHGIGAMRSNRFRRQFDEHGYIISLMHVKPRTIYTQGLSRTWNRRTKEDFFQKELQHIGMQEILNKEIYAAHTTPDGVFSYQDRYDDYRRAFSSISGEFKTTLDHWHMARVFSSDPALNDSFLTANPTTRVYQSTATDQLYIMANHSIQARRMLAAKASTKGF